MCIAPDGKNEGNHVLMTLEGEEVCARCGKVLCGKAV